MTDKFTFKTSDETGKMIRDLADSDHEGSLSQSIIHLLEKALNMENRFGFLDDTPCKLRDYLGENEAPPKKDGGWYCMKKAPALKLLGSGIESAASKICGKCKIRDEALEDSKILKEQRTKGIVQKIPQCARGAQLNEAMDEFNCPERGRWRPIIDRNKKTDYKPCRLAGKQNANCEHLSWITVKIKGKLPDGQNL